MTEVMRSVDNYPEAVFIDIGANIGSDLNSILLILLNFRDVYSDGGSHAEKGHCCRSHP